MELSTRVGVNGTHIVHEGFDDEVVIVNLDSGRYYCLRHEGAEAWTQLLAGFSIEEIALALSRRYDASAADIAPAIDRLCGELIGESLVAVADRSAPTPLALSAGDARRPFTPPQLQVFTDMQDLLLLDPIHEVDPAGWPVVRGDDPQPQ